MNDLTEKLVVDYVPKLAIVVYEMPDSNSDYYLESHVINEKGQLLEGRALQQETIENIVEFFYKESKTKAEISGIIPAVMLQYRPENSGYKMAWYRPAEKRNLFFSENLHIQSGMAWVPAMLYVTDGHDLSVYALGSDERPEAETPLFRAPFHNVSDSVCLGSAKVAKPTTKTYENLMKYWEDLFWLSEFTHIGGGSPTVSNLNMIWDRLVKDNSITWASISHELKQTNKTLKEVIR